MEEFRDLAAFLEHVSLVMETIRTTRERVSIMTLHRRERPGVRDRVPARLGGRPVPPARAGRKRQGRPRGGAPPCLCRHHPRAAPRQDHVRVNRRSTACGTPPFPRASSTNCPKRTWRSSRRQAIWRLRRQPLRPDGALRLDLQDPRLAARAGAHEAGRRRGRKRPGGGYGGNSGGGEYGGGRSGGREGPAETAAGSGTDAPRYNASGRKGPCSKANSSPSPPAKLRLRRGPARLPYQVRQRHGHRRRRQQARRSISTKPATRWCSKASSRPREGASQRLTEKSRLWGQRAARQKRRRQQGAAREKAAG